MSMTITQQFEAELNRIVDEMTEQEAVAFHMRMDQLLFVIMSKMRPDFVLVALEHEAPADDPMGLILNRFREDIIEGEGREVFPMTARWVDFLMGRERRCHDRDSRQEQVVIVRKPGEKSWAN